MDKEIIYLTNYISFNKDTDGSVEIVYRPPGSVSGSVIGFLAKDKAEVLFEQLKYKPDPIKYKPDPTIERVLNRFKERSAVGFAKYTSSMNDNPGDLKYWLKNIQEELMDGVAYIERTLQELENAKTS
jgi:hypothetical protein